MQNKLRKSSNDKVLSGVCGGIAEYVGISSMGVRILFLLLPVSVLVYFFLAFSMPFDDSVL
ncbi:PspC domain-containing protein [Sporosarcina jeotgali]|uniref:PspC domain-containing protein n=1 Tax=Sporosarcina jeotgali TaxID=3020056 RepID=A0ABZ0KT17_9BACL|nr:PspC domain-containing protein [Sporosarcina sp. B2O-1]WOV82985.1 PspC domain-containing protein [Sporosarcina sp. B2O-1]